MPDATSHPPNPLLLHEYEVACRQFFGDAVDAIATESSPIYGQIQRERVEVLAPSLNTMADGQQVSREPMLAEASMTMSIAHAIEGDFTDVYVAMAETAEQILASLMPQMFGHISDICDATGNTISGAGRDIWETLTEALESIEISFDSEGDPSLPTLVMHPDAASKLADPPEGFEERWNEIIRRKRDEWLATRRTRRLPRHGH